jgi:hypothetical protein
MFCGGLCATLALVTLKPENRDDIAGDSEEWQGFAAGVQPETKVFPGRNDLFLHLAWVVAFSPLSAATNSDTQIVTPGSSPREAFQWKKQTTQKPRWNTTPG